MQRLIYQTEFVSKGCLKSEFTFIVTKNCTKNCLKKRLTYFKQFLHAKVNFSGKLMCQGHLNIQTCMQKLRQLGGLLFINISVCSERTLCNLL